MILHDINPIAFEVFGIAIRWYGISYVVGIIISNYYAQKLSQKYNLTVSVDHLDKLFTYLVCGIILGGRLGYIIIYDFMYYFYNPLEVIAIYKGGMSFHGGLIGVLVSSFIFCRKYKIKYLALMDLIAIVCPVSIGIVRLANFVNGELYGRVTDIYWGIVFPLSGDNLPRHPSQLYEAVAEGLILSKIMYFNSNKLRNTGYNSSIFLLWYGILRIICEFFREPDIQISFIANIFTMGQLLSFIMVIIGYGLYFKCKLKK